jgi:hypothetical protein
MLKHVEKHSPHPPHPPTHPPHSRPHHPGLIFQSICYLSLFKNEAFLTFCLPWDFRVPPLPHHTQPTHPTLPHQILLYEPGHACHLYIYIYIYISLWCIYTPRCCHVVDIYTPVVDILNIYTPVMERYIYIYSHTFVKRLSSEVINSSFVVSVTSLVKKCCNLQ